MGATLSVLVTCLLYSSKENESSPLASFFEALSEDEEDDDEDFG